jgi:NADH dehydrogenase [ubiquinone] 1 alpha subcomplex assembly factor 5
MVVFNRDHKRRQRSRAAARPDYDRFTYIRDHLAAQVVDRLQDVMRDFPVAVDVGCGAGHILKHLPSIPAAGKKVGRLIQVDSSLAMLRRSLAHKQAAADAGIASHVVHADEEFLPIQDGSVDLVVSCMSLHWINDLPGTLIQIHRMLKPDGVFLGVMLGGETLNEVSERAN